MKPFLFYIVLISALTSSCSGLKSVPSTSTIVFEKTACYGTCPIYKMTLDGTGKVVFEGDRFTDKIGRWEKQLESSEVKEIFNLLISADWRSFQDEYPTQATDFPSTVFYFKHKKTDKVVVVTGKHPEILDLFATRLSKLAESSGWENKNSD